jgi:hypothetical protein
MPRQHQVSSDGREPAQLTPEIGKEPLNIGTESPIFRAHRNRPLRRPAEVVIERGLHCELSGPSKRKATNAASYRND